MNKNQEKNKMSNHMASFAELSTYLRTKAGNHKCYKLYVDNLQKISCILEENGMYLSDGEKWNDTVDRDQLNATDSRYKTFVRSFSFSKSENVAMWMLYGGIHGIGYMLNIKPSQMKNILDVQSVSVGKFADDGFKEAMKIEKEDIEIYLSDVVYYSDEQNGTQTFKRSDERVTIQTEESISLLDGVRKHYPWFYENECRLMVKVKRTSIDEDCHHLKITFADCGISEKQITVSPNGISNPKYTDSFLKNRMNWQLCDKKCSVKG